MSERAGVNRAPKVEPAMCVQFKMRRDGGERPVPAVVERISHPGTPETGPILELTIIGRPIVHKPAVRWTGTNAREYEGYVEGYYDLTERDWAVQDLLEIAPRLRSMLDAYEAEVEVEEPAPVG